jgi:hypothetical protein
MLVLVIHTYVENSVVMDDRSILKFLTNTRPQFYTLGKLGMLLQPKEFACSLFV